MLIPLNRATFEQLVPLAATGAQYRYLWGTFSDFLRRLLVSFAAVIVIIVIGYFLGEDLGPAFQLIFGILAGCYWLWVPIFLAAKTNWDYRRYQYSGFWRGEVLDKFVTDEVVSTGEQVNKRGELVVTQNREKRLNLDVGDETGFTIRVNVPYKRNHQGIRPGDVAEMVVVSTRPDLGRLAKLSDVYVRDSAVWVSNYPYVQRAAFLDVEKRLEVGGAEPPRIDRRIDPRDRYPDAPYPNDYPEDRYPNDYPDAPYPDDDRDDRYDGGRYPDAGDDDGQYPDVRYSTDPYGRDPYPNPRRSGRSHRRPR
ncbi:MAG: phosphate ABC transporter permease [Leptolyngbyaceae bacterium]|nr:phosphate ABC transporter permease [Leptolyngbyaceae bacterium]